MQVLAESMMASKPRKVSMDKWLNPRTLRKMLVDVSRKGVVKGLDAGRLIPDKYLKGIQELQVTSYKLQVTSYKLQVTSPTSTSRASRIDG